VTEVDAALQKLLHADDLSHLARSFPSCAAGFRRGAARLVPGARD
jgi:hypothetical protein